MLMGVPRDAVDEIRVSVKSATAKKVGTQGRTVRFECRVGLRAGANDAVHAAFGVIGNCGAYRAESLEVELSLQTGASRGGDLNIVSVLPAPRRAAL